MIERSAHAMFVLRGVGKAYGGTAALAPLSIEIAQGERIALLGPSGSGKTTLLHVLGSVVRPSEGDIMIDGRPLDRLDPGRELARLVGIIHQQLDLVPHLAVVHNVMAGRLGQWGLWRSLLSLVAPRERERAEAALERVGILHKLYERTSRLSGGEQQRVAIARLLVQDPVVILADEPVAALDPARASDLIRLLVRIAVEDGKTLVASLHNVAYARAYFTRAVGLRAGRLEFDVPVDDLTDEMLTRLYDLSGVRDYAEDPDDIAAGPAAHRGAWAPDRAVAGGVRMEPQRRPVE